MSNILTTSAHKIKGINHTYNMRFHAVVSTGNDPRKGWRIPLNEIEYNEQRDEETGYGYFGARYMDHELMTMWLSADPLVLLAAGDATVTARQEGDVQYAAAEPVSRTFHIEAPEPQSITWTQELDHRLAEGRVALTATATSGLPVSYSCSNSGVALVRGDTLVLLATGTATVTARQEGDARYAAAEPVSKTLRVSAEGIGEASAEGLTLYPNPTTGVVHVGCDGCTVKEATVISDLGRRERVACRDGRIDLSHLAAGVYYLEVRTDTGVRRKKITKL